VSPWPSAHPGRRGFWLGGVCKGGRLSEGRRGTGSVGDAAGLCLCVCVTLSSTSPSLTGSSTHPHHDGLLSHPFGLLRGPRSITTARNMVSHGLVHTPPMHACVHRDSRQRTHTHGNVQTHLVPLKHCTWIGIMIPSCCVTLDRHGGDTESRCWHGSIMPAFHGSTVWGPGPGEDTGCVGQ